MSSARVPVTTYRLQLQSAFTFDDARAIVPYLAGLGVTDVYASPFFRAKPGSTHGYDVCDFGQLNPELGGDTAFEALAAALTEHGMGVVADFVPNHMGVEPVLNPWWRDVLEHGQASPHAAFFDIDWDPEKPELVGKVLLPFLGEHYGKVLDAGELSLAYELGELVVRYGDLTRPIDPKCYPSVFRPGFGELLTEIGDDDIAAREFPSILTALDNTPAATDRDPAHITERLRECRFAKERLAKLVESSPRIAEHVGRCLAAYNGTPGDPDSFDALHELLERQSYRLANWKTAAHEINYRRFFDINQLAGLRPENEEAFVAMHALIVRLVREGKVHGLRLDHVDGLFDPAGYLRRLRQELGDHPAYVVVEKILSHGETLPAWAMEGTTGYDFLNDLSRLFVRPRSARRLRRLHARFTGTADPFPDVVYECKKLITWTSLAAELNVLAHALNRLSEGDRRARDFTLDSLREALREVAVCFPVYRTYADADGVSDGDRRVIDDAIRKARRRNPATEASVFEFVRECLIPDPEKHGEEGYRSRLKFAMKFQQYTGPLQAKGVEDTAFYRYHVLDSLNEVGGEPNRLGSTVAQFHRANAQRRDRTPHAMLSTATHDTKRGEDARARIHVLSELPRTWSKRVREWATINAGCRSEEDGAAAPDRNDEYLFYQTLVGCWPAADVGPTASPELVTRLCDYMQKALKEAKANTSWITPNEAYDKATRAFVEGVLTGPRSASFLARFLPFQRRVARAGVVNSLAQLVLKAASPGVPDFYQGTELWDLSLVDPDNRRPVDYPAREAMLTEMEPWLGDTGASQADQENEVAYRLDNWADGRIKLFVTAAAMRLRRRCPDVFLNGEYIPLPAEGRAGDHAVAFARRHGDEWVIAVAPRLSETLTRRTRALPLGGVWGLTHLRLPAELAGRTFRNVLTRADVRAVNGADGGRLRLADILTVCPVALLHSAPA